MTYYGKELYHHGINGQKWGNRRWQNEDGSLTPEGRIHYGYGPERKKLTKLQNKMDAYKEEIKSNARFTSGRKEAKANYAQAKKEFNKAEKEYKKTDGYKNRKILMKAIDKDWHKIMEEEKSSTDFQTKEKAAMFERIANEKASSLLSKIFGDDFSDVTISNKFYDQYEKAADEASDRIVTKMVNKYGSDVISDFTRDLERKKETGQKITTAVLASGVGLIALTTLNGSKGY